MEDKTTLSIELDANLYSWLKLEAGFQKVPFEDLIRKRLNQDDRLGILEVNLDAFWNLFDYKLKNILKMLKKMERKFV